MNQAKKILADIEQRGDEAFDDDWEKLKQEIFSSEEILASEVRTTKILNALSKIYARTKQIFKAIKYGRE